MSEIPTAIRSGAIVVCGMKLALHVLDNGQRVIDADDMRRLIGALDRGEVTMTEAEVVAVRRQLVSKTT